MVATLASAVPALALAQSAAPERGWTFAVEPYLWAAGIDGTLEYDLPPSEGEAEEAGLTLDDLEFAFMVNAEARRGNWAVLADLVYVDIAAAESTVSSVRFAGPGGAVEVPAGTNVDTSTSLEGTEWGLAASYTAARGERSSFEILGGVRYLVIDAGSAWQLAGDVVGPGGGPGGAQSFQREGSVSTKVELWDGIVGVRGSIGLGGDHWFVPYYADVGTGSSSQTWQAVTGLGYRFSWGDLKLSYRYLRYDMEDDDLLQNLSFAGFGVGARFRF